VGLHVFVETNFVVEWAAPAHLRAPAARELVDRAARDELTLYVPAICLSEAGPVLRSERWQPRRDTDPIRSFLRANESLACRRVRRRRWHPRALHSADVATQVEALRSEHPRVERPEGWS